MVVGLVVFVYGRELYLFLLVDVFGFWVLGGKVVFFGELRFCLILGCLGL